MIFNFFLRSFVRCYPHVYFYSCIGLFGLVGLMCIFQRRNK